MDKIAIIGQRIKAARKAKAITQEELGVVLGYTKQNISNWERGRYMPPSSILEKLCETLNMEIDNLYRENVEEKTMDIMPFEEIKDMNTLQGEVKKLLDACSYGVEPVYERTITRMLSLTLYTTIAYECYANERLHKKEGDQVDWPYIAADLRDVLKNDAADPWPISWEEKKTYGFTHKDFLLSNKIEWMADHIAFRGWDDHGDSSHRSDYMNELGEYGLECGYELFYILPDKENMLITMFKSALACLVDEVECCGQRCDE